MYILANREAIVKGVIESMFICNQYALAGQTVIHDRGRVIPSDDAAATALTHESRTIAWELC